RKSIGDHRGAGPGRGGGPARRGGGRGPAGGGGTARAAPPGAPGRGGARGGGGGGAARARGGARGAGPGRGGAAGRGGRRGCGRCRTGGCGPRTASTSATKGTTGWRRRRWWRSGSHPTTRAGRAHFLLVHLYRCGSSGAPTPPGCAGRWARGRRGTYADAPPG